MKIRISDLFRRAQCDHWVIGDDVYRNNQLTAINYRCDLCGASYLATVEQHRREDLHYSVVTSRMQ